MHIWLLNDLSFMAWKRSTVMNLNIWPSTNPIRCYYLRVYLFRYWKVQHFSSFFIRPSVFQTLMSYPITMRPALLINLFIYLFDYERSKLFFQNASSHAFMIRFLSYYTYIIPRESYILLVLGLAIWRFLAIWWPISFSPKNGYVYSDARN